MLQELRRSDEKLNTTEKRTEYKRKSQITYLIQVQETQQLCQKIRFFWKT